MAKRITVIDDDEDLRNLIRLILIGAGYHVETFFSGSNLRNKAYENTDLYLMDINLGDILGLDLCKLLKTQEHTKHIPIIIISAHPDMLQLAMESCADDALSKPFTKAQLLDTINKHLK